MVKSKIGDYKSFHTNVMKISTTARKQYSTHEIKIYTSNIEEFNKMKENFLNITFNATRTHPKKNEHQNSS